MGGLFALLGMENIADPADAAGTGYPQLSAEFILAADPDFIFLADTSCCGQSAATVAERPGWAGLQAVAEGRVVPLDDDRRLALGAPPGGSAGGGGRAPSPPGTAG